MGAALSSPSTRDLLAEHRETLVRWGEESERLGEGGAVRRANKLFDETHTQFNALRESEEGRAGDHGAVCGGSQSGARLFDGLHVPRLERVNLQRDRLRLRHVLPLQPFARSRTAPGHHHLLISGTSDRSDPWRNAGLRITP